MFNMFNYFNRTFVMGSRGTISQYNPDTQYVWVAFNDNKSIVYNDGKKIVYGE